MENIIELNKLENRANQPDGTIQARCPCCAENGRDKKGNHLRIWPTLAFNCVVAGSDKEHNARILQLIGTESDPNAPRPIIIPKIEVKETWPISILSGLVKNHEYWNSRNISPEVCDFFNIGVALKGKMINRTVVPIFNATKTKIIGFSGRRLNPKMEPKWKHLGEKSDWIFPRFPEIITEKKSIILVESPGDVLYLWENGIKNTVCLFGTVPSSLLMGYIIAMQPQKVLISTNNEMDSSNNGVGNESAFKIKRKLLQFFREDQILIALPPKKDFGECSKEELLEYTKKYLNE